MRGKVAGLQSLQDHTGLKPGAWHDLYYLRQVSTR